MLNTHPQPARVGASPGSLVSQIQRRGGKHVADAQGWEWIFGHPAGVEPTSPLPDQELDNLPAPMGPEPGAPARASVSPICETQTVRLWLTGAAGSAGSLGEEEQRYSVAIPHACQSQPFLRNAFITVVIYSSPT